MARNLICSIDGCCSLVLKKGWCSTHYWRWFRTGDPLKLKRGPARSFYEDVVLKYEGDECLIWPFAKDKAGYAQIGDHGSKRSVHRLVCIEVHGEPPSEFHQAAHACGKGHEACVNKNHVSWKTPRENTADQVEHGTRVQGEKQYRAKLTEIEVRAILRDKGRLSQRELARRYKVGAPAIFKIVHGTAWKHISRDN